MKRIIKFIARFILRRYTGKAAGVALDLSKDKVANSERIQRICQWSAETAEVLHALSSVLADGNVTDEERAKVVATFDALGEKLAQLIEE